MEREREERTRENECHKRGKREGERMKGGRHKKEIEG